MCIHFSIRTDTMPLITSATPSTFNEPTQPHAHLDLTTPSTESSSPVQHVDEPGAPPAAVAMTRNEANHRTGISHSLSRCDDRTQKEMSSAEEIMLELKGWCNFLCYSEPATVQRCVQNYCGDLWRDFSDLIGLSCTRTATSH